MDQHELLIQRARDLRRHMTPAERILWRHLRNRRFASFKFRRQHVIDPFIVDFCCLATNVIVELDGESHLGREAHDQRRQAYLESHGYSVVRCWNSVVYDEIDTLLDAIWQACNA